MKNPSELFSLADTKMVFKLLTIYFPQSAKNYTNVDDFTIASWWEVLSDIPRDLVFSAVKKLAVTNVFAPSISEIREVAVKSTFPDKFIPAAEAWGMVYKAITKYGSTNPLEAYKALPEAVARCVKNVGWRSLCMAESIDVSRAHFTKAWEEQGKRDMERLKTPQPIAAALTAKELKEGGRNEIALL